MSAARAYRVEPSRAEVVVEILVGAFDSDPLWGPWAFPDSERRAAQHRRLWGLFVDGALGYEWVWLTPGETAASVWIPPGGVELSDDQAAAMEPMLVDMLGAGAGRVLELLDALDGVHPHDVPHYYLSLLGTDPGQRGRGHGLGLLAANLEVIDAEHMPAYLEASNPANVALYARHGFEVADTVRLGGGAPDVATMWRPAAR